MKANGIMTEKRMSNLNDPEIQKKLSTGDIQYIDSKSESLEEHRDNMDSIPVDDHLKLSFKQLNQPKKGKHKHRKSSSRKMRALENGDD